MPLANPGIVYSERASGIPVRPNQELKVLIIVQGRTNLVPNFSQPIAYSNYDTFLSDLGANTSLGYERQAVFFALLHHQTVHVLFLKAATDLTAALNATEFSGLVTYPFASTLATAPRNAAYTTLLGWATNNASELFVEPAVTANVGGYVTATPSTLTTIQADLATLTLVSSNGHWRYIAPNLLSTYSDGGGTWFISAASVAAAVLARRVLVEGIRQPGAGVKCAISGVSPAASVSLTSVEINTLNQAKVNPIAQIAGVWQPYAANTMATLPAFESSVARQVFNTIRRGALAIAGQLQFESIDGQGELFQSAHEAFGSFMYRLWSDGALFGRTPDTSYTVVCDSSNNRPEDLEANILTVDIYAIPSPFSQQVKVSTIRKAIGTLTPVL